MLNAPVRGELDHATVRWLQRIEARCWKRKEKGWRGRRAVMSVPLAREHSRVVGDSWLEGERELLLAISLYLHDLPLLGTEVPPGPCLLLPEERADGVKMGELRIACPVPVSLDSFLLQCGRPRNLPPVFCFLAAGSHGRMRPHESRSEKYI